MRAGLASCRRRRSSIAACGRRQALLEEPNKLKRLEKLAVVLSGELEVVDLEQKIKDRVREQIDKNQREYYLREQLKAIHDELGETTQNDIEMLRQKIADAEGAVTFTDAPGDRGTEVAVDFLHRPRAGDLGECYRGLTDRSVTPYLGAIT